MQFGWEWIINRLLKLLGLGDRECLLWYVRYDCCNMIIVYMKIFGSF